MKNKTIIILQYIKNVDGIITNSSLLPSLSSYRMQQRQIIEACKAEGLNVEILSISSSFNAVSKYFLRSKPYICFVGKINSNNDHAMTRAILGNLTAIYFLKEQNVPIVSLISNNHSRSRRLTGMFNRFLLNESDYIICPSVQMQSEIYSFNNKSSILIEDPWQIKEPTEFKPKISGIIKIIWFGVPSNWSYMEKQLHHLFRKCSSDNGYELTILSQSNLLDHAKYVINNLSTNSHKWRFRYVCWDYFNQPAQLSAELSRADICLIPSDPKDPSKNTASHNRLVDSLRCGSIPIVSGISSYLELYDCCLIGDNFADMLNYTVENYESLSKRFSDKRKDCLYRFSPQINLKKWQEFLKQVTSMNYF